VIEVRDLAVSRGGNTILDGCSFSLRRGAILAVLGKNGVGKTSLLSALVGTLAPDRGSCRIGGRIGYVPQLFNVPFSYSVMDIALMGRAARIGLFGSPGRRDYEAVRGLFDLMGIAGLEHQTFNTLSGGQRQMVMIAQALASECDLLILDEPCSALDYRNQGVVIDLLDRLCRRHGITIVFTTHTPQHAIEIATDALLINGRDAFAYGPVDTVLTSDNLSALYEVRIERADFVGSKGFTYAPMLRQDRRQGAA
jgi:iron complex transport system ATP-binding protein